MKTKDPFFSLEAVAFLNEITNIAVKWNFSFSYYRLVRPVLFYKFEYWAVKEIVVPISVWFIRALEIIVKILSSDPIYTLIKSYFTGLDGQKEKGSTKGTDRKIECDKN